MKNLEHEKKLGEIDLVAITIEQMRREKEEESQKNAVFMESFKKMQEENEKFRADFNEIND